MSIYQENKTKCVLMILSDGFCDKSYELNAVQRQYCLVSGDYLGLDAFETCFALGYMPLTLETQDIIDGIRNSGLMEG